MPTQVAALTKRVLRSGMIYVPGGMLRMGSVVQRTADWYRRKRPAARHAQPIDTLTNHIGYRCVIRKEASV